MSRTHRESLIFPGPNGRVPATLVRPPGTGPWPGVFLVHEAIGVTDQLLRVADRFAEDGYLTLVPDLYARDDAQLASAPASVAAAQRSERARVLAWSAARDRSTSIPDLRAALASFRDRPGLRTDAIAAVGFSLGGGLVARLAAEREALAAAVVFYGVPPEPATAARIRVPVQAHYAQTDPLIAAALAPFVSAIDRAGVEFTSYVYPGTRHGFFNDSRPAYDAAAALLAWRRTIGFLRRKLDTPSAQALRA